MSLTLHFHPLASFCWKALIALYENDTPFAPNVVDLGNAAERAALLKLWPIGKFPVLRDDARDQTIPESSIIIEYLDRHYPGRTQFIPADPDLAWQTREDSCGRPIGSSRRRCRPAPGRWGRHSVSPTAPRCLLCSTATWSSRSAMRTKT